MKIFIMRLNIKSQAPIEFEVNENTSIPELKKKLLERIIVTPTLGTFEARLRYILHPLNHRRLSDHAIKDGSILTGEIWESKRVW